MVDRLTVVMAAFALVGAVFVVTALVAVRRRRLVGTATAMLLGLLCLALAALAGSVSLATRGYQALTREVVAAKVMTRMTGPQQFVATFIFPDGRRASFDLTGDGLYVDAHVVKWHPLANLVGLHTAYQLDRVGGRYDRLQDEQTRRRRVHAVRGNAVLRLAAAGRALGPLRPPAGRAAVQPGPRLRLRADGARAEGRLAPGGARAVGDHLGEHHRRRRLRRGRHAGKGARGRLRDARRRLRPGLRAGPRARRAAQLVRAARTVLGGRRAQPPERGVRALRAAGVAAARAPRALRVAPRESHRSAGDLEGAPGAARPGRDDVPAARRPRRAAEHVRALRDVPLRMGRARGRPGARRRGRRLADRAGLARGAVRPALRLAGGAALGPRLRRGRLRGLWPGADRRALLRGHRAAIALGTVVGGVAGIDDAARGR